MEVRIKRIFDIVLALLLLLPCLPILVGVSLLVRVTSPGPVIYWSNRIGKNNLEFSMPKFRTMCIDAPVVATHLLHKPSQWLTIVGAFLRRTSLDELPQLWSILKGDMSFVGPRPALFNQGDLISLRTDAGIHKLLPGLTGLAQINGRDDLSIADKVKLDAEYLEKRSIGLDLWILWMTLLKVMWGDGVSH